MANIQGQGQAPPAMGNNNQIGFQNHLAAAQQLAPGQQLALPSNITAQQFLAMQMAPQVAAGMAPPPFVGPMVWPSSFISDGIEAMWEMLREQLNSNNLIIEIAGDITREWDKDDIEYLIRAYSKQVGYPGMLVRDATVERVLLGPTAYFNSQDLLHVAGQFPVLFAPQPGKESLSPSSDPVKSALAKVPRPPNAFIIYRKEHHHIVLAENPGMCNNDISVIIGRMWAHEPIEVRDSYKAQAKELKEQHLQANPGYTYQPRKPSEKKRRKSKKSGTEPPSLSLKMAKKYKSLAKKTGVLAGHVDGVRTASFPATESVFNQIEEHNAKYQGETRFEEARATPVDLVPSAEYVAVQQADELIVDLANNVYEVDQFFNTNQQYDGIYSAMIDEYSQIDRSSDEWMFA